MRWYISYIKKPDKINLDGILLSDCPSSCKKKKRNGIYYIIEDNIYCIVKSCMIFEDNKDLDICKIISSYNKFENASKRALMCFFKEIDKYKRGLK